MYNISREEDFDMSEFLEYVLWQLQNSLILVLLAGIVAVAVIVVLYLIHRRKYKGEQKFPWGKIFLWFVFLAYLVIVLYATILRNAGGYRDWNLHLFRAWREAWNNFSTKNWANVLLNIAMFGPLGFLLPLMSNKCRKWYATIPIGFGASLAIELLQLAMGRGICDVDDLFCNALGAAMGYFAIMAILSVFNEKGKRVKAILGYTGLIMVPVIVIGSIFAAYHIQEYGNLPEAAAYSVNLDHLEWNLDCDLSDSAENVPVYRTQIMSKADCDTLAAEIAALSGNEIDMVSYYQEMAYYNFSGGIIMVYYHDGSYEFRVFDLPFEVGDQPDRESIVNALEPYPIVIPKAAEFTVGDDGWYSFTCDQDIDGAVMVAGTLRGHYEESEDHTRLELDNHLVWYTHYKDVPVISPEEAYQELKDGSFAYAEVLKHYTKDSVTVLSCTLDYEIDTKGFYQPVYIFEILIPETGNTDLAMIPAMK